MKTTWIIVGVIAVALIGWFLIAHTNKSQTPVAQVCTDEAMICPDGSSVGRTGPNCSFAPCPHVLGADSSTVTLSLNESTDVLGTTLKVFALAEDSRCPVDVQCIQAGTVRVRVGVGTAVADHTFTLGESQTVGNLVITLTSVTPKEKRSTETIKAEDYRFTFTVVLSPKG
ncbi:MAG: hypothetical protein JWN18_335 [Parcubacteria group bacterium]|nr:hypothetical protein [Parcubacteria group bacterium]